MTKDRSNTATPNTARHAANCRWGASPLFLQAPYWFDAEQSPWACVRDAAPCVLSITDRCTACARWEQQPHGAAHCVMPGRTPDVL